MSSTASNYNVKRLCIGIAVASIAMLAVVPLLRSTLSFNATTAWMCALTLLYGIMMFASSYVEEEQQFWYWATSGWFMWISVRS